MNYDLGIARVYEKDKEFENILIKEIKKSKKSYLLIDYENVDYVIKQVNNNKINFRVFLDLSSHEHPIFSILIGKLKNKGSLIINDPESIIKIYNKAKLHKLYEENKLPVRKTFVFSPKKYTQRELKEAVSSLGQPFILSQAATSYENVIVLNAKDVEDIENFLNEYETEECLAHEYVLPKTVKGKVAWFRIIYSNGKIIPHWWDPQTHFYKRFSKSLTEIRINFKIKSYIKKIAELTEMKLFSTEIIINKNNKYIIIDYLNNPIDLSSQEYEKDGVPKQTLNEIAESIVGLLKKE